MLGGAIDTRDHLECHAPATPELAELEIQKSTFSMILHRFRLIHFQDMNQLWMFLEQNFEPECVAGFWNSQSGRPEGFFAA
jgi:hypothetical protein